MHDFFKHTQLDVKFETSTTIEIMPIKWNVRISGTVTELVNEYDILILNHEMTDAFFLVLNDPYQLYVRSIRRETISQFN